MACVCEMMTGGGDADDQANLEPALCQAGPQALHLH